MVSHGTEVGPSQCCGCKSTPKLECIDGSLAEDAMVGTGDTDWQCGSMKLSGIVADKMLGANGLYS